MRLKLPILFDRFLALPTLLHAPRDLDRAHRGLPPRRIYEVEPAVLGGPHVARKPIALDLDYSEDYRRELARAHAELYLVRNDAAALSVLHHRAVSLYRDPVKVNKARQACNGNDPYVFHLNPILLQLGLPQM